MKVCLLPRDVKSARWDHFAHAHLRIRILTGNLMFGRIPQSKSQSHRAHACSTGISRRCACIGEGGFLIIAGACIMSRQGLSDVTRAKTSNTNTKRTRLTGSGGPPEFITATMCCKPEYDALWVPSSLPMFCCLIRKLSKKYKIAHLTSFFPNLDFISHRHSLH